MTPSERYLTILLRVVGTAGLLALVAVFMPRDWMAWCHRMLGLGPLPAGPVIEYLARSASLFYAIGGAVLWWLSLTVRRLGRAVVVVALAWIGFGMMMLVIDVTSHMPWWWTTGEGPATVAVGIAMLVLELRSRTEVKAGVRADAGKPDGAGKVEADVDGFLDP